MPGSGDGTERVRTIHAIPGRPDVVLVSRYYRAYSPPSGGTWVYDKQGDILPEHFGEGVRARAGPTCRRSTRQARGHGNQNSGSAFDFWEMAIDASGVHVTAQHPWGSVLSGYNVGRIGAAGGRLLTDRGEIVDLATRQTVGSFEGGGNFLLDPARGQWFSLATGNGTTTLNVYDLNSLQRVTASRSREFPPTRPAWSALGKTAWHSARRAPRSPAGSYSSNPAPYRGSRRKACWTTIETWTSGKFGPCWSVMCKTDGSRSAPTAASSIVHGPNSRALTSSPTD